ncbi:MAG: phosphatidate cytidylyltransferase [Treponema sp.]|nr:phosphatidate cytidylyltransferase [Treponema sp.]
MAQRFLIFFLGLPAIVAIVLLLPHYRHLVFNLLTVIFSALGAAEFSVLLSQKKLHISKTEAALLGALPPAAMLLIVCFGFHGLTVSAVVAAAVSWLLVSRVFSKGDKLEASLNRLVAGIAVLMYPGMMMVWLVRMSQWETSAHVIILAFLCSVFGSDSAAWAVGMLFGKGNQGIVPASPNKSVAGFIGGIIAPTLVGMGAAMLYPEVFVPDLGLLEGNAPVAGAILGLLTGIAATLGDLAESAIKRSSGIKDSGNIIPGRGGVLDSIDSIVLAAPVFYLAFRLLFAQP